MPGILKKCSCCAAKLEHRRKLCGRCKTPYCGPACQKKHWEEGGHDKLCKKIKKGGGAELYNADTKYKVAVAAAAKKCAEDTKGQTCFICTQALHWKTKEGLVRGCACRGTAGFAHVSCLAEQVKILVADAQERNLDDNKWTRWHTCSLCEQEYHGIVRCALGWACWKTYVGRAETDWCRLDAITMLGNGLSYAGRSEEALSVRESELSTLRRLGANEEAILVVQSNLANTYHKLGRKESLNMYRDVYSGWLKLSGEEHRSALIAASNYALSLLELHRFEEPRSLMRRTIPVARRVLGESNESTLKMRKIYAGGLYSDPGATLDELHESARTFEELAPTARRVFGSGHPFTEGIEKDLRIARAALGAHEIRATLPVPRFKVGARVECSVKESFLEGTVVRHHYRESDWAPDVFAPYQVKLDGQSPGLIYARWDEDDCIRAAGADSDAETIK